MNRVHLWLPRYIASIGRKRLLAFLPFLSAGIVLWVYISTMAPTVYSFDSAELTTAAYSLGLVHAPGYPLYLILTHFFLKLPVGDIGYRANLFSAVASAGTVALIVVLVNKICDRSILAIFAGLCYGFCFYAWSVSVVAEVYAFQGLLLIGILVSLVEWSHRGRPAFLLLAAGLMGLAVANNPATLLWWPGLLFIIWSGPHRRELGRRYSLAALGGFVLALAPIFYLPWRSSADPEFVNIGYFEASGNFKALDLTRTLNLVWYLSGQQFESLFFAYTPMAFFREVARFSHALWAAYLGIGMPLGIWGISVLWTRWKNLAKGFVLTMALHALFFIGYGAIDKETMFLPVFIIWAVLMGLGFGELTRGASWHYQTLGLLLPFALVLVNQPYADVSNAWTPSEVARVRLRTAAPNTLYLVPWGDAEAMEYHQIIGGIRRDVKVINVYFIHPEIMKNLVEKAQSNNQTVYAAFEIPALIDEYHFESYPNGFRLSPKRRKP